MQTHALKFPTLTIEHPLERLILRVLVGVTLLLAVFYVYLISASTFHIIARKQAETNSIATQSSLAQINAEYYTLTKDLTESQASRLGLSKLSDKEYITRTVHVGFNGAGAQ